MVRRADPIATNLSLWPKDHCLHALRRMGQSTSPEQVVTAVHVVVSMLEQRMIGVEVGVVAAEHVQRRLSALGYHVNDLVRDSPQAANSMRS
jgi:ribonucleotide monophosphatase NagD (HAD superfamily)